MRRFLLVCIAAAVCAGCVQSKDPRRYPVYRKPATTQSAPRPPVASTAPATASQGANQGAVVRRAPGGAQPVPVPQPAAPSSSPAPRQETAPPSGASSQVFSYSEPAPRPATPAPRSSYSYASQSLDPSNYRLAPGDAIRVDVFGEPDLSLNAAIESSGSINYPLLGRVEVAGTTVRQLESRIAAGLRGGYLVNPDVRVSIAQYRPIFVTGQVRRVGAFPYAIGMTIDRALTMAGGITEFGSSKKIYLQRENTPDDARVKVDLDASVYPGDTVLVEERLF